MLIFNGEEYITIILDNPQPLEPLKSRTAIAIFEFSSTFGPAISMQKRASSSGDLRSP